MKYALAAPDTIFMLAVLMVALLIALLPGEPAVDENKDEDYATFI